MSDQELARLIEALQRSAEENNTPEKARRQLQEEGILGPDGQLAEPYRF